MYVWKGVGDLQVEMRFNSFPTVAVDAHVVQGHMRDLSDTVISLTGSTADPDGDPVVSTLYTTDCAYAYIGTDPTSLNAEIVPVNEEVCTATLTSCDSRGCNQAWLQMDIACTTLGNGFDGSAPGAIPLNNCFLESSHCPPGLPPDPAAPNFPGDCIAYGWDCGDALNACNQIVSCGTCSAPLPACDVNTCVECVVDGDCAAGWKCQGDNTCLECTVDEAAACAGIECGLVPAVDACGDTVDVDCDAVSGGCSGPCNVCDANACRCAEVYACENTMSGQTACSDWLESDGWDLAGAQFRCADLADPSTSWAVVVADAATICINQAQDGASPYHASDDGRCKSTMALAGYLMYAYSGGLSGGYVCNTYIGEWQAPVAAWDPMY
jgi:hypothetical protein